jgi:hypothetical protein
VPEVTLNDLLIEIGQPIAMLRDPPQEPTYYVEGIPYATPSKPRLDEARSEALDKLSMWPVSETLVKPASVQISFIIHRPVLRS